MAGYTQRLKKLGDARRIAREESLVVEHKKFTELFTDKLVLIVGPSKNATKELENTSIDEYDVVCRLNWHYKNKERTDAVYHCLNHDQYDVDDLKELKEKNITLITRDDIHSHGGSGKIADLNHRNKETGIPFYCVPDDLMRKYRKSLDCNPNTGTIAILHILSWRPEKLTAVGFDFYETLYEDKDDEEFLQELHEGKFDHNPQTQFENFKNEIKKFDNFEPLGRLKEKLDE
jgi:hypothetical protein